MDFVVIGLAAIAGISLVGWKQSVVRRIPIGVLVTAVVLSAHVGRHPALLRVGHSLDIMRNEVRMGVGAAALIYRNGELRRRRSGGEAHSSEKHVRETEDSSP